MLLTWTATCLVDVKESILYIWLWYDLETPASNRMRRLKLHDDVVIATKAAGFVKFMVIAFVLLPKLLIALALWWLGARWLSATPSFQDLVLNAVALAFITELDELIYSVLVPEDVKELVQVYKIKRPHLPVDTMDKQEKRQRRDEQFCRRLFHISVSAVIVIGFPIVYMHYLQQVLPEYRWDVHEVCEKWFAEH